MPGDDATVKLSLPLEYQQDIFHELRSEDELLILAPGLGLLRIVTNLLHSYDVAGNNLILLVGADERENGWIGEALAELAAVSSASTCRGLSLVNTDVMSVGAREKMYTQGGIFSITSRILIVDFLSGLLDPAIVTGVVVLHADRVTATSLEAFILRIYRQKNREGFLKAFSDRPEPFTMGFSPLANMMRNLFLRKAALYPRFQVSVAKSLEGRKKAEVIELEISMTEDMRVIQNAILECIEVSISDLKKSNPGLDVEDWNVDSALHRNFDSIVRRQLDPVWHRTTFKTKQVVRDLTLLQNLLHNLLTEDCVNFNKYLDTVRISTAPEPGSNRHTQSPWMYLDAANTIFETAKRRVYTGKLPADLPPSGSVDSLRPVLEEQPKWSFLAQILEEIETDLFFNPVPDDDSNRTTLIMCGETSTCAQLREYLRTMYLRPDETNGVEDADADSEASATFMMRQRLRNYLHWKKALARTNATLFARDPKGQDTSRPLPGKAPPNKRRRVRGGAYAASNLGRQSLDLSVIAGDRDSHISSLLTELNPTEAELQQNGEIGADPLDDMDKYYELYDMNDIVVVHPYDGDMDEHVLEEIKPRYVVMYEPDAAFIRRVEVYRSSHRDRNIKVYFMYYRDSVEEQRYLSTVRKEKDSFTKLIRERGAMALTLNSTAPEDPQEVFLRTINTRIAGGGRVAATAEPPRVVVDVREFRSSLPSELHRRRIQIVPSMLTIGDYVLTTGICVERKSVRDLIQSLNNGRLYSQAESMIKHYENPMLLIEFEREKAFTLEMFSDHGLGPSAGLLAKAGGAPDLQAKIVMLTLAFPKLKIIWSSSPYQTAEIFEELKRGQPEPDPIKAVEAGLDVLGGGSAESGMFASVPGEMLRMLPGVTEKVALRLQLEVRSINELANMTEDQIGALVGKEVARQIVRFFEKNVVDE